MRTSYLTLTIIFSCFFSLSVFADQPKQIPPISDCSKGGSIDQVDCLAPNYEKSQQDLAKAVKSVPEHLPSTKGVIDQQFLDRFKTSQIVWEQYRETLCERDFDKHEQSHAAGEILLVMGCKYKKNLDRIQELQDVYLSR